MKYSFPASFYWRSLFLLFLFQWVGITSAWKVRAQQPDNAMAADQLYQVFLHPPKKAKPWVYWYWMRSSVTREGITADLEAMKQAGIGGAYLMTIRKTENPPYINPPVVPLTPEWWQIVRFALSEARRLGIELAMTPCDGWALAGGPWITPELSMQKVVWTKTAIQGGRTFCGLLKQPETYKDYYKDIAVYAYPSPKGSDSSTETIIPRVSSSTAGQNVQFLAIPGNKKDFISKDSCWIQLAFDRPFTCRSLTIRTEVKNSYQAQRLIVEVSDDGKKFRPVGRLNPPRNGWQDKDAAITHSLPPVTAQYFRFLYSKEGTEPGAEDLDNAKWEPELRLRGITLSSEPKIHQYEGKSGAVWRVGKRTTKEQLPDELCVPADQLINLTGKLQPDGRLVWEAPPGDWIILRMGHTSTGHTNAAAGIASGLECDKFNPQAVKLQFDGWFGKALRLGGPEAAKQVLNLFHVDSWECGSQNWSPVFAAAFKKQHGYNLLDYLPVMAGVPVGSAAISEKVLSDVRETITALVAENFFGTLEELAHKNGCSFSAESVAPTMTSDGMLHFSKVDIPMGEFWFRSPTHDKPNDILDAVSGGHIYGKNIIQAEAFTELRLMWDEHPALLKTLTDLNFSLGVNRYVFHVNAHNPWLNRKPGMTLDGIGVFLQRDQTWWKPGKAWVEYIQRCQALLQQGRPVADIAVFTGEETPRRALLPDRLVTTLPGIFGAERVKKEQERLVNEGIPLREVTEGYVSAANMADPAKWTDPLRGYAYDSFNKDALLRLATVHNGRIELPGGASYAILVIPGPHPMSPDNQIMSPEVIKKLIGLAKAGATIVIGSNPVKAPGMQNDQLVKQGWTQLTTNPDFNIIKAPYVKDNFDQLHLQRDIILTDLKGDHAADIAWNHRAGNGFDIYFISNQQPKKRTIQVSLRKAGSQPELWDPLTGEIRAARNVSTSNGRTELSLQLEANGSVFVVIREKTMAPGTGKINSATEARTIKELAGSWKVAFDPEYGGPKDTVLFTGYDDWSKHPESTIRYYSGTAVYTQSFDIGQFTNKKDIWLQLDSVANLAEITVNGTSCGVAWTPPYRVNISKALRPGINQLQIAVTNTWANRLIGDQELPEKKRITWTSKSPVSMKGRRLLPAGLLGAVKLVEIK
ncbi:MAG: glycosyl hydrolase [Niabella sp.]